MRKLLFLLTFSGFLVSSCNQNQAENGKNKNSQDVYHTLPTSNGSPLDVIVVAKSSTWGNAAGDVFRKFFMAPQAGLPQAEPIFSIHQVPPESFNSILERSRNLIYFSLGSEEFSIKEDQFARPQLVVTLQAPDEEALAKLVIKHREEIINRLHISEVTQVQERLIRLAQPLPTELKAHHVSLQIPKDFEIDVEKKNTLVFWKSALKSQQGIIIHFEPIHENDLLLTNRIVPLRDSLTRLYVPGEKEGSYMMVENFIPPTYTDTKFGDNFAIETRGLWKVKNDLMGGSFIDYTIFDDKHQQRIVLDAFIYAPELKKRNPLLELEAILRTFKTTD